MVIVPQEELRVMIRNAVSEAFNNAPKQDIHPDPEPTTELMTRKEVRKLFGVSLPTLVKWSKENVLPCLHFNRCVRYRKNDVEKLLKTKSKNGGGK